MKIVYELYASVFARPSLYRLNRFLFSLAMRGLGILNWTNSTLSGELPLVRRLIRRAPDGAVVVDVGANVGRFAAFAAQAGRGLVVHALEPNPSAFSALSLATRELGVRCHNFGVGREDGKAILYDYSEGTGSSHASVYRDVITKIHKRKDSGVSIKLSRLDSFFEAEGIKEVYILKLDLEGGERDALLSIEEALLNQRISIKHVIVEFNWMNVFSRSFVADMQKILSGFRVYRILPRGRLVDITEEPITIREIFAYQNILFSQADV